MPAPIAGVAADSPVEVLRRTLLVLVTALIVARPLVLGEDPGLSSAKSDNTSMVLSFLWLLAGVGWAVWRLLGRRGEWYVGVVEAALGVGVVLFFVSAETAANKHPAHIIAWEWLVLLVSFVVVRHLAATPDARHGLFAVFLASGIMIATYGLYQAVVEVPTYQNLTEENLREKFSAQGMQFDDATFDVLYKRVQDGHAYSTFAHPNSFAGYMVLMLPGLIGAAGVCLLGGVGAGVTRLAVTTALLGLAGLWVTHSRGGILALAAVGSGLAALYWRRELLARKALTFGIAAAVGVAAVLIWRSGLLSRGVGKDTGTMAARIDYWRATAKMIGDRPWLGVGPGNFGGYYPRYMAETAGEKIKDPHNFVLELWATGGLFVLLAVLTALAAVVVAVRRNFAACGLAGDGAKPQAANGRWEYYVGGVLGLLLACALRMTTLANPDLILQDGLASAARSVVWLLAFVLFDRIAWTDRQRVVALTAGIAALLLNLGVSGGIGYPSVAGPLWVAVALLLACLPIAPRVFADAPLPSLGLPIPVLGAVALLYVVYCLYPVSVALGLLREAEKNGLALQSDRIYLPIFCAGHIGLGATGTPETSMAGAVMLSAKRNELRDWAAKAPKHLEDKILVKLHEAGLVDPDNPRVWMQLGLWYGQYWEFRHRSEDGEHAGGALDQAVKLDPNSVELLLAEVQLWQTFARYSRISAEVAGRRKEAARQARAAFKAALNLTIYELEEQEKKDEKNETASRTREEGHLRYAADTLRKAVTLDPTDAPLRFQLAEALDQASDHQGCREEAREALRLDGVSTQPPRRLTDPQRLRAKAWAERGSER